MQGEALEDRLRQHVDQLAGKIGERNVYRPAALHAAQEYIHGVWSNQGYRVEAQAHWTAGLRCANLEITRQGEDEDAILVIGAHYDTVARSPGADDNASGVAALLELAQLIAESRPRCTLRLVAFVNEESPFFFTRQQGSRIYAHAAQLRGDPIRFMLSLEMLGYYRDAPGSQRYPPMFGRFYPDTANFIALVSNLRSRQEMQRVAGIFRAVCDFPLEQLATFSWIPGVAWSDHSSFWREGYRAMMLTDTAFFRNPHYHAVTDRPVTLDYRRMSVVTRGLADTLCRL